MAKMTYTETALLFREASNHCLEKSGTYSAITGAYESILADIVADLPAHKQAEIKRNLESTRSYIDTVYSDTPSIPTPSL